MWHQFLSIWQDTFVGNYPVGVVIAAFQIGGLLAFGSVWYHSTRNGIIYRDELMMLPAWIGGLTLVLLIYQLTSLWPGLLALLQLGTIVFATWAFRRRKHYMNR